MRAHRTVPVDEVPEIPVTMAARPSAEASRQQPSAKAEPTVASTSPDSPTVSPKSRYHALTSSHSERRSEDEEEEDVHGSSWAVPEENIGRMCWEALLVFMLIYIGTIFPYRLAFITFAIPKPGDECSGEKKEGVGWLVIDWLVDAFFWCDLFLNFFFTYRRRIDQKEEYRLKRIVRHYLRTFFFLNLVACLPAMAFEPLINWLDFVPPGGCDDAQSGVNKAPLLARMQRMTKIARLTRLVRLVKMTALGKMTQNNRTLQLLRDMRAVRITNWVFGLSWVVHLLSCGWYLCAALHSNPEDTWVGRRSIGDGLTLQSEDHSVQWAHSMYFVLTVFTTVGFGDISAVTVGEIMYVGFCMLIGAVVHSIVVGEMVSVVNELDEVASQRRRQKLLLTLFSTQTFVGDQIQEKLLSWVDDQDPHAQTTFDREEMRKLLTAGAIPRKLLGEIPKELFKGELMRNQFMTTCALTFSACRAPPRFSLLMATSLSSYSYKGGDVVYQMHDHAICLYLVLSGTFALVAEARSGGGKDVPPRSSSDGADGELSSARNKRWRRPSVLRSITQRIGGGENVNEKKPDEKVFNLPEDCRTYSSSVKSCSTLHARGHWTPMSSQLGEFLQLDLTAPQVVVGVILQGRPDAEEWVTEIKISYSNDEETWIDISCNPACFDKSSEVYLRFSSVLCRFIRLEPISWHGSIAMRAAALVRAPKLSPYRLFGLRSYFGDKELLLGGTRDSTTRCESEGQVLLLRKNELFSILGEFPQIRISLRCCAIMRDVHRTNQLKAHTVAGNYKSLAVTKLQAFAKLRLYRRKSEGSGPEMKVVNSDGSGGRSPVVDFWAKPSRTSPSNSSRGGRTSHKAPDLPAGGDSVVIQSVSPEVPEVPIPAPRQPRSQQKPTSTSVQGLADDVAALRAEQREIKDMLQAVVAMLGGSTSPAKPDSLTATQPIS